MWKMEEGKNKKFTVLKFKNKFETENGEKQWVMEIRKLFFLD